MSYNDESKRILIVDDKPTILLTLSHALRSAGVEVITASRIDMAEAALGRYIFGLVIADIRMSGILGVEGLELLSYIKRYWPQTKVAVMTAYGSEALRADAYERGADLYFEKSADLEDIVQQTLYMVIPSPDRDDVKMKKDAADNFYGR